MAQVIRCIAVLSGDRRENACVLGLLGKPEGVDLPDNWDPIRASAAKLYTHVERVILNIRERPEY